MPFVIRAHPSPYQDVKRFIVVLARLGHVSDLYRASYVCFAAFSPYLKVVYIAPESK